MARHVMRPGAEAEEQGLECTEVGALPVPGLDLLPEVVRLPKLAELPGAGSRIAAAALERRAGGAVWKTLEAYSRSLEAWMLRQLEALQERFDAEAGVFRAEIARLLSAGEAEAEHQARLEQWLEELERAEEAVRTPPGGGAVMPVG
jgi:2-keto-3-deoxy-galactonokinase